MCGDNDGTLKNCYNTGIVSGSTGDQIGGVCGINGNSIENCHNAGIVNSTGDQIGGVCGDNTGILKNCYNTGAVSGSDNVGGVLGRNVRSTIENCYNIGKIEGSSSIGGVCGDNDGGTITNSYYDSEFYKGEAIGKTEDDGTIINVKEKITKQFKSGEVAWLLQDGQEDQTELVWGQTLTGDSTQEFPVLKGEKVYKVNKYAVCEDAQDKEPIGVLYSNSDKPVYGTHKDDGSGQGTAYDNKCDFCGKLYHTFNDDGICEEDNYHQGVITNTSYNTTVAYYGEDTDAQPKPGDFTVASGTEPEFTWYKDNVITGDLPTDENALGKDAPKNEGTYTLVVNAAGAENNGVVYTATELRVLVTIAKAPLAGTVTLEGTLKCKETVTVNTDDITHPHPGNLSYQWYRVDGENETEIAGATEPSYTLTTEDIGKKIKVVVSAAYCDGTLEATTDTFVDKLQGTAAITSISDQLSKDWDGATIVTPLVDTKNNKGESNENVIFEYKKSTEEAYTQTAPTDVGTYDVRVRVKEDAIYHEAVSEPVKFTIAKVDATVKNAPIAAKKLTYDQGKNITLINEESAASASASVIGGELKYAFSEDGTYSTSLPTVTEAGIYSVYYKVVGDRNHNDTEPIKINVTVSKAVPSYQVPTDISATCGAMLSAVQLPIGFGWTDKDVTLEAGDTATGIQIIKKAKYVPEDTKNYEEVTDIAITIQVTHDSEVKGVVEPTCTEKGYSGDTYCKSRNKKIQSGTDIAALGHDMAREVSAKVEATCTTDGKEAVKGCSRCDHTEGGDKIAALGHDMAREVSAKVEATCTTDGKEAVKGCSRCDHTEGGDKIAALGHDFAKDFTVDTEATCTTAGSKSRHCSRCEEKTEITEIPKSDHAWDDGKVTKAATCISKGEKIYSCKANGCNATKVEEIAINPDNHVGETELRDAVEPTCTGKGYSGDTYCKSCNKKLQSGTDIAALGHDMAREVSAKVEATCITDGKEAVKGCTRCDHTEGGDKIAALGHDFTKDFTVDTEATCATAGSKSRHCSRCEEKTEITEIPKKEHTWDDGKVTKEATETEEGVKTYSCKKCDATKTETVPKKDAVTTQPSKDTTMTQPPKEEPTSQEPTSQESTQKQSTGELTVSQPAKNGDVITDNKSDATYEVTDTVKREVTYNAPVDGKTKDITIPDTITINGEIYKVMKIADNAFKGNKAVTTITIGRNVKSIGKNVFKGCKRLKTIIIKSKKLTTKTVSKKAFKGISKKVVIKVPKKKLVTYKKLLKKKGLSSKNRIKGY